MPKPTITTLVLHLSDDSEIPVSGVEKDALVWGEEAAGLFLDRYYDANPDDCPEYEMHRKELVDRSSSLIAICHEPGCNCCRIVWAGSGQKPTLETIEISLSDGSSIPFDAGGRDALFWISSASHDSEKDAPTALFMRGYEHAQAGCPEAADLVDELRDPDSDLVALCHEPGCNCCEVRMVGGSAAPM